MQSFKTIKPSRLLAPYVQRYWMLETDEISNVKQRIISNGCIEMMFNRGDSLISDVNGALQPISYIKGHTTSYYDLLPSGKVNLISIALTPIGAKTFLSIPTKEFYGKTVEIGEINNSRLSDWAIYKE